MTNLVETTTGRSVPEVIDTLRAALARRGIRVFAVIDHAAAAREAGLELHDETVVVFGDPAVGTALMLADPRAGIDLPLRIVAWSDGQRTHVAHRDIRDLTDAFDVASEQEVIELLLESVPDRRSRWRSSTARALASASRSPQR